MTLFIISPLVLPTPILNTYAYKLITSNQAPIWSGLAVRVSRTCVNLLEFESFYQR